MKKLLQLCVGLMVILCVPFLVSCSDDDNDPPLPYYVAPKADIEFKGANLKTVQEAVQGTWWIKIFNGKEYSKGGLWYTTIKDNRIITYGGALVDYGKDPEWYDISWTEIKAEDGSVWHGFFPKYPDYEVDIVAPYVPYRIKDNVLIMGYSANEDPENDQHYILLLEE